MWTELKAFRDPLYRQIALQRKPGYREGIDIPTITSSQFGHQPSSKKIDEVAKLFAVQIPKGVVPFHYPHFLAHRLLLSQMLDRRFPLAIMGTIHLAHHIKWTRPLRTDEKLDMQCTLGEYQTTRRGIEFSHQAKVFVGDDLVWQETATLLNRIATKKTTKRKDTNPQSAAPETARCETWEVNLADAKRYADLSEDYNPIHMHPFTARLFGFKQAIAHGMWSLTKAGYVCGALNLQAGELRAAFKRPLFLPGQPRLWSWTNDGSTHFKLTSPSEATVHMSGELKSL